MRFSFAYPLVILSILAEIHAISVPRLENRQKNSKNKKPATQTAKESGTKTNKVGAAAPSDTGNKEEDPQKSLTLDPKVIGKSFRLTGQETPAAGQVASLTTVNNFINFCLTVPDLKLTDGAQSRAATCNTNPIGAQVAFNKQPSGKFVFPLNGQTIAQNKEFTIQLAIKNLETGNFANAATKYFAGPQQLNEQGIIKGHSHVVIEQLEDGLQQIKPTDPSTFAFFKGLNDAAKNGILTADVSKGVPCGAYRLCSIHASTNHVPCLSGVAQHGFFDDCIYFTANDGTCKGIPGSPDVLISGDNKSSAVGDKATTTAKAKNTSTSPSKGGAKETSKKKPGK